MYPIVTPPPLAAAQATQPQNRKRKRTNAALPADLTNTQTAQLQQPPPIPTIQSPPLEIMRYIHAQLRLRADVFDDFHMLMWRHLLSNDIPRLEELARIVNPHMGSIPAELCPAIVSSPHVRATPLAFEHTQPPDDFSNTALGARLLATDQGNGFILTP